MNNMKCAMKAYVVSVIIIIIIYIPAVLRILKTKYLANYVQ